MHLSFTSSQISPKYSVWPHKSIPIPTQNSPFINDKPLSQFYLFSKPITTSLTHHEFLQKQKTKSQNKTDHFSIIINFHYIPIFWTYQLIIRFSQGAHASEGRLRVIKSKDGRGDGKEKTNCQLKMKWIHF